jgi:predicted secreted hydrolase
VVDYLSARTGAEGFARADRPRAIAFPADAGPHPDYQTEWWYYTGNLEAEDGRRFGFQLTFFRRAMAPPADRTQRESDWAMDQLYLAHFALTDVAGGSFHSADRLSRGAAGLAGAQADPFRVWVETWSAAESVDLRAPDSTRPSPDLPVRLVAADGPVAIDLLLSPEKPPVLHGDAGLSPKGPEPGNASFYYSFPRLGTVGTVTTAEGSVPVSGQAWMDHEWSTSALGEDQTGWDWFSLQLDEGRELMVFQLRERDGGIAASSSGSLIDAEGRVTRLGRDDFAIVVKDSWTSPRSGGVYPAGWRLTVPGADLDLSIDPVASDQELDVGFKYWEGAVDVEGTADGRHAGGQGYVELTGYAPSAAGGGLPGAE